MAKDFQLSFGDKEITPCLFILNTVRYSLVALLLLLNLESLAAADGLTFPGCREYTNTLSPSYRVILTTSPHIIAADGKSRSEITIELAFQGTKSVQGKRIRVSVDGEDIREYLTDKNGAVKFTCEPKKFPGYYRITADAGNCDKSYISSTYVIARDSVECGRNGTVFFRAGDKVCGLNIPKEEMYDPHLDEIVAELEKSKVGFLVNYWLTGKYSRLIKYAGNEQYLFTPEEIVEAINRIRSMYGRNPLYYNSALALAAKNSGAYLRVAGLFYDRNIHVEYKDGMGYTGSFPEDRMAEVGYPNGSGEQSYTAKGNILRSIAFYSKSAYHLQHFFGSYSELGFCTGALCDGHIEFGRNRPSAPHATEEGSLHVWPPDGITLYSYDSFTPGSEMPNPMPAYKGDPGTIMIILDSIVTPSSVRLVDAAREEDLPLVFEKETEAAWRKGDKTSRTIFMNVKSLIPGTTYRIQWADDKGKIWKSIFHTASDSK
jgi:hypothetical protein